MTIIKLLKNNELYEAVSIASDIGRAANIRITRMLRWLSKKALMLIGGTLCCVVFFFIGLLFSKGEIDA